MAEPVSPWPSVTFYQTAIDTLNQLVGIGAVNAASTVTQMLAGLAISRDAL